MCIMFWSFLRSFLKGWFFPKRRGYSLRGFWGEIRHFDKNGVQIGYSVKSFWGGRKRYDMNGNLISYTLRNFGGGYNTYDANGNLIRKSYRNFWGGYNTYNRAGKKIMESYQSFWRGMNHFDVEASDSKETYVFEKHTRTKVTQNAPVKNVSNNSTGCNSSQNHSLSAVKSEHEKAHTTKLKEKKSKEDKGSISVQFESTHNCDTRCTSRVSSLATTDHIESSASQKADLSKLFQQHIDKSIPFYESLTELSE